MSLAHAATHVGVNREVEGLDEETAGGNGHSLEVDLLRLVVDGRLSRLREA